VPVALDPREVLYVANSVMVPPAVEHCGLEMCRLAEVAERSDSCSCPCPGAHERITNTHEIGTTVIASWHKCISYRIKYCKAVYGELVQQIRDSRHLVDSIELLTCILLPPRGTTAQHLSPVVRDQDLI
jgi:hypothetical protein